MTLRWERRKIWWEESTGREFSWWGWASKFSNNGGTPPIPLSRENPGQKRAILHLIFSHAELEY